MNENEKINIIIIPLDMNNQKITNVEVGDDDRGRGKLSCERY